ncbi:MAG: glycosyltransferase [Bacilli bacterium]|nr:glycosyltransferase [Bacilli bacterium]
MKIIYFTTAQKNSDFSASLPKWKKAPNTSNQNFHNKLIRALSTKHEVFVIAVRPINDNFAEKELRREYKAEGKVIWNYIKVKNSKVDKLLFTHSRVMDFLFDRVDKDDVVLVDTLSRLLLIEALKIKRKYHVRAFGICTDNPYNISYTTKSNNDHQMKLARELDGYIALTDKINELFNPGNKPHVIIDGINEEESFSKDRKMKEDYIFFGGSLMKKYGVYNLIDAFKQLNKDDIKLVLCGHHEEDDFKEYIKGNDNIIYLGTLNYDEVRNYASNALVCVNPRPENEEIDLYSIPSKTLEYLACGSLTITTKNILLQSKYNDAIIWAESGEVEDIKKALTTALDMSTSERKEKINLGKRLIKKYTSFESVSAEMEKLF